MDFFKNYCTVLTIEEGEGISEVLETAKEAVSEVVGIEKPGIIKQFLDELPSKALTLGIRIVLALLFFFLGVQIIKIIRKIVRKSMNRASADIGAVQFVDSFLKASLYALLVFLIASSFGVDAASIVALVGSAGVAIGLAVQGSLSNLAGGVLILMLKPFRVGDYIIDASGHEGSVSEIQIFYTKLMTPDNKTVILPNGALANNSLINVTASDIRRMDIIIGISYQSDIRKAKEVLTEVLEKEETVIKDKEKMVFVDALADSSVNLGIRCWLKKEDFWTGKWRITENCKYALDAANINIPFPQMDVTVKKG